jgi:hypothetical protein
MHKSFNADYAAKTPKEQWLKEHEHVEFDGDLDAEWESAQGKKKPVKKDSEEK